MMLALPHSNRVRVFLDPRTTDVQTAEVGERLRASGLVTAIHYVDDQEAWDIFFKAYCAVPEIVRQVDPYSLPNAYDVSLVDADDLAALQAALAGVPGVDIIGRRPE
jgi:cell division protein FtsX